MKVIIAGGRDFIDIDQMLSIFDELYGDYKNIQIVSGTANGADRCGEAVADIRNLHTNKFPAEWEKYGKSAGYIRNDEMAEYANALIALWDGKSKGTKNMIDIALKKGLEVHVYRYFIPQPEVAL